MVKDETQICWVRHGPTHAKCFLGVSDWPADLSDTAKVAALDAALPRPAVLVSSDLSRARTTADAVGTGRRRLPHTPDLREFNFGDWEEKRFDEVAKTHPELSRAFWETPGDLAAPGGESWNQVSRRVEATCQRLMAEIPGEPLIIVAHMGVIMSQIALCPGMAPYTAMGHEIAPLSVTRIGYGPEARRLISVNEQP